MEELNKIAIKTTGAMQMINTCISGMVNEILMTAQKEIQIRDDKIRELEEKIKEYESKYTAN